MVHFLPSKLKAFFSKPVISHPRNDLPKPLKNLAFERKNSEGNNVLHKLVLDCSLPNSSVNESYLKAVLRSMDDTPVNDCNDDGYNALHLAVLKNNVSMVETLLSCLTNIDVDAICRSRKRFLFSLENTALHLAVEAGHFLIVQELLNNGANPDVKNRSGKTPLMFAARKGNLDIVKLLVSRGADVNMMSEFSTSLHYAAESGSFETFIFLMNSGAYWSSIDYWGDTILHVAARSGALAIMEYLIGKGFKVNVKNRKGKTPLHLAARWGKIEAAKLLINNGADLSAIDNKAFTILHHAARSANFCIVELFVNLGANVNAKDKLDRTPLHPAAFRDNLEIVKLLVNCGANVNVKDKCGETPLHKAASSGRLENVKYLVGKGANLLALDSHGYSPLHHAERNDCWKVSEFLQKQAKLNAKYHNRTLLHGSLLSPAKREKRAMVNRKWR